MMQETGGTDPETEFGTGKRRISWKSAEDLSAFSSEYVPSEGGDGGDIAQLSESVNSFHTVSPPAMPSTISTPVSKASLQPVVTSTPKPTTDSPTPSIRSIGADLGRPNSLSVDTKSTSSHEQNLGTSLSPVCRYQSGESSDERVDKKLKSRQSSNEGSFERSISFRDGAQEQIQVKKSDHVTLSDSCKSNDSSRGEIVVPPPPGKEKDKKYSKVEKKGRKAWYNILINPTYKSRSHDLKRLFKQLPSDERLVVDYSCALQKDILLQGRLYVTQNYFCFYSKIFGWETNECIKCKEIISVTKEKTALVIPNALQINTKTDKHFLTSFVARDKTYMILFRCWQNALLGQQMSNPEMWQYVHACYGEELGLTSDDDDYVPPTTEEEGKTSSATLTDVSAQRSGKANSCEDNVVGFADLPKCADKSSPRKSPLKGNSLRLAQTIVNAHCGDELNTDSSDAYDSDLEKEKILGNVDVTCPNCITHHVGREMSNRIYGLPIDQLFTLLFTNSKFMLDLHTNRKTTDVQCTNWQSDEETNQKIRQVTYTMALPTNSLGPKVSHVTETQVMAPHSAHGRIYSIDAEACNGGIPYADSFYVSSHWCLTRESAYETRLAVWTQVKYKKSVWGFMKSVIDKNSYNGVDNMMADLNNALQVEVINTQQSKGLRKRWRRMGTKGTDLTSGDYQGVAIEHAGDLKASYLIRNTETPTVRQSGQSTDRKVYFGFFVLALLLFMNFLLYQRLTSLEFKFSENVNRAIDFSVLRIGQAGEEGLLGEWMNILQQQEKMHALETNRWKDSVSDAADHLKKAEESLRSLQASIPSQQRNKIQSLLDHLRKIKEDRGSFVYEKEKAPVPSTSSDL